MLIVQHQIENGLVKPTCVLPVGFPGSGNATDQYALPGCSAWSYVLLRAQPGTFPCWGCGQKQVQYPHQKSLHLRYENLDFLLKLSEIICLCDLGDLNVVWNDQAGFRTTYTTSLFICCRCYFIHKSDLHCLNEKINTCKFSCCAASLHWP